MTEPFLAIRGLAKKYGSVTAVDEVSLDIAEGEFVTFLGPSGSGKSTTLYVIAGLQDPSAGDVLLKGSSMLRVPPNERNIGMVFQRYTLFPHLTVAENVAFPLRVRRRSRADIDAKVKAMLELVRLEAYANRMPSQLSGGQQQRVALARALAYDPPILLMDEPLAALDKKLREEIQYEIKRVHLETGVTILYVTHDQEEALRLSDRIALFNNGRVEQVGSGRDLYEAPASRFVASFIGHSNFISGVSAFGRNGTPAVRLPDGTLLPAAGLEQPAHDAAVTVMIRPDAFALPLPGGSAEPHSIAVTVKGATYLGDIIHLATRTPWGEDVDVRLRQDGSPMPQQGESLRLKVNCGNLRAFRPHPE
ncbi:ABC transporter ATP-binding protein [Labrys miyagiensis]|uniref:ABC transporter ATP-binding protein n=1 Tax=Labrys miyagiensis TaxID=346912 RepID=A0ABQ6CUY0_9HYPH|nr:ABC transporter ATP-binding protein [Labrys miyagiensis]GLS24153.1 ABC transporter ATP-binding protein [Labrys miyagiensis]